MQQIICVESLYLFQIYSVNITHAFVNASEKGDKYTIKKLHTQVKMDHR